MRRKITWLATRYLDKIIMGYCWRPDARHANMNFVVQCADERGVTIACTLNGADKPDLNLECVHGQTVRYALSIITNQLKEKQ